MNKFPHYTQHDTMDCGPTCLRMVAAYYGKRYSLEGLREKSFITTEHPPIWIVARGSGKIQEVYSKDREKVETGDIIAVLENPARTADVLELKRIHASFILTDSCICQTPFPEKPKLGNIQNTYASFIRSLTDYRNFLLIDLYSQKEKAACKELQEYQKYIVHMNKQAKLDKEQVDPLWYLWEKYL